jgi:hypothetical protein
LGSGIATFNGGATVIGAFNANGISTFNPTGAGDVVFTTDEAAGSYINITGLDDRSVLMGHLT